MRRRGFSSQSLRNFIDSIGYTKFDALNDYALLEASVRDDLNKKATRVSAVLDPIKLVITNYPEDKSEELTAINNPENESDGTQKLEAGERVCQLVVVPFCPCSISERVSLDDTERGEGGFGSTGTK